MVDFQLGLGSRKSRVVCDLFLCFFFSDLKSFKKCGLSGNKYIVSDEEDEGGDEDQSEDESDSEGDDMVGKE